MRKPDANVQAFSFRKSEVARRIDIVSEHGRDRWLCMTCSVGETMPNETFARVVNRATLHNIRHHRDGYLIRDTRIKERNHSGNIRRSMESVEAYAQAKFIAEGPTTEAEAISIIG